MSIYTSEEMIRFIEAAGESAYVDAKGPMNWDGAQESAALTKDILSFANSRDGGVIVIGKEESSSGTFELKGLTSTQASSFETTKVATWVNNHCAPPTNIVCNRVKYEGKEFILLTVAEFEDVPIICTKQYELAGKPPKVLLRKGTIYNRTANAESAPLSSIEDLRTLIGLATTKRSDQMLSMFQAMLKGRPLLTEKSDEDRWSEQAEIIQADLDDELGEQAKFGRWQMQFHPDSFQEERWENALEMKALIEKHAVHLGDEFPGIRYGYHVREWGICSHEREDIFGLMRSGLFLANRVFREDMTEYKNPWQPNPDIPPGNWFEFQWNMANVIEFFMFMSRFCHEFQTGEQIVYQISASPLANRALVSLNPRRQPFFDQVPCRANSFIRKRTVPMEILRSAWEDECAQTLLRLFELVGSQPIELSTLQKFIELFKDRKFWN